MKGTVMIQKNIEADIIFTVHDFVNLTMEVGYKTMLEEVMEQLNERNYQFTEEEKEAMSKLHDEWSL